MRLVHDMLPFASAECVVIIFVEFRIVLKMQSCCCAVASSCGIIHLIEIGISSYREQYQLHIGISILFGERGVLPLCVILQFFIIFDNRFKFMIVFQIVGVLIKQFGCYTVGIFALHVEDTCSLFRMLFFVLFGCNIIASYFND